MGGCHTGCGCCFVRDGGGSACLLLEVGTQCIGGFLSIMMDVEVHDCLMEDGGKGAC